MPYDQRKEDQEPRKEDAVREADLSELRGLAERNAAKLRAAGYSTEEEVQEMIHEEIKAYRSEQGTLRKLIEEAFESGPPISISREEMKTKMRERMAQLSVEVERGERPAPGGPGSITV